MKTRIVLAGLVVTLITLDVSAQRAEYDDMYFNAKDREKNKAIQAEESRTVAKVKQQQQVEEEYVTEEEDTNPLDSYSARNVNPEYVSRANSEEASADEENYFVEGYTPPSANLNYNNSYYNNSNSARNSYYANNGWYSPYYGGMYNPWMMNSMMYSPYGYGMGYGFYDPWMSPYGRYGMGSGWSMSIGYGWGNNWGWGGYPYYGGGMWNNYYWSNNYYGGGYYEQPRPVANYGRRPSRNSAVVTPSQRTVTRSRTSGDITTTGARTANTDRTTTRVRTRQTQDEYYVRPAQRTTRSTNTFSRPSNGSMNSNQGTTPSRSREYGSPSRSTSSPSYSPSSTPSRSSTPSYSPSPSRSSGGGSSGGSSGGSRSRGRN